MILKKLNVPFTAVKNGAELQYRCICPEHRDRHASAYISTKNGLWHCFSCNRSGNLKTFISNVTGDTKSIRDFMDESDEFKMTMESIYRKSAETILTYENDYDFIEAYKAESENFVDVSENRDAFHYVRKKRKLSNAIIDIFGLKYAKTGTYEGRVIIPYFRNNIPIGFNSRYIGECADSFRYRYMINKHRFDDYLFNEDMIHNNNYCILVEGPFDLMYMVQCGFENVVSTLNTRMSNGHLKKLLRFKKIIFCFDNDEETHAGQNAVIKHAKTILKYRPELPVYTVKLPVGKDPNECTPEEIENALCHLHRIKIKTDNGF